MRLLWERIARSAKHPFRTGFVAFALFSVGSFAVRFWQVYASGELFNRLAYDWSLFWAQGMAFRSGAGPSMYEIPVIDSYLQTLLPYYTGIATKLSSGPVPYPPLFAAIVALFTLPPPPLGFALWLTASLGAALWLAHRVRQFIPVLGVLGASLAVLATVPVSWAMYLGQPTVLLAVPVAEALVSFHAGREFRAGLWLAVLLFKPQYLPLFALLLVWKRRGAALAGMAAGGLVFVAACLGTAGLPTLLRFPSAVAQLSDVMNGYANAPDMINARALVLAIAPGIGELTARSIVWAVSALVVLAGLIPWRGAWAPRDPSFPVRFSALTFASLLSAFHSHPHGATILVVPLAAAWATRYFSLSTRVALWLAAYATTVAVLWVAWVDQHMMVTWNGGVFQVWPAPLPAILFFVAFALVSRDLRQSPASLAVLGSGWPEGVAAVPGEAPDAGPRTAPSNAISGA